MPVSTTRPLAASPMGEGNHSKFPLAHWENRAVNSLPGKLEVGVGLFVASLCLGMLTAYVMDKIWREEKDFNDWHQFAERVSMHGLLVVGLVILSTSVNLTALAILACLTAGFIAGLKVAKHFIDRSDHRIAQVAEQLAAQKSTDYNEPKQWGYYIGSYQLCLRNSGKYIKYLDLKKLFNQFQLKLRAENNFWSLSFSDADLTDSDLRKMAEAGFFDQLTRVNLDCNSSLTAQGLIAIGSKSRLKYLELSGTNLKDADFQRMAESGCFNNVEELMICNTPGISAKGLLEWVGKKGFPNLKRLNISYNTQFTGKHLQDWIGDEGFTNLQYLDLSNINLTGIDLEQMIEKSSWFRNLEKLDLSQNENFRRFPKNVLQLTKTTPDVSSRPNSGDGKPPGGCYIVIDSLFDHTRLERSEEIVIMGEARKVGTPRRF